MSYRDNCSAPSTLVVVDSLRASYDEIYLVRNEKYFKIYDFDSGQALEPDEWKEQFLQRLKAQHQIKQLWRDREYTIWGMPFYNRDLRSDLFDEAFTVNYVTSLLQNPNTLCTYTQKNTQQAIYVVLCVFLCNFAALLVKVRHHL